MEDYYIPNEWRKQSQDNKQASDGLVKTQILSSDIYEHAMSGMIKNYKALIDQGVAKEQARIILPLSMYTEVYWTASFQAIMNFIELRADSHAQWEIQQYAQATLKVMEQLFPVTTKVWAEETNK